MRRTKAAKAFLVSLVLLSYCGTIPVLSVVHWHTPEAAPHLSLLTSGGENRTADDNPLACALCARLASSLSFVTHVAPFLAISPLYGTPVRSTPAELVCFRHDTCLDRAPPPVHTV
jgi:hypothetical protein